MNKSDLITLWHKLRRTNKGWYSVEALYNGYHIKARCYNTWCQRLTIADTVGQYAYTESSPMELSVAGLTNWLNDTLPGA